MSICALITFFPNTEHNLLQIVFPFFARAARKLQVCLLIIIVTKLALGTSIFASSRYSWLRFLHFHFDYCVLTLLCMSMVNTLASFCKRYGLQKKPRSLFQP